MLDALHNRRAPSTAHPNPASGEATSIPPSAFEVDGPMLGQADPNTFAQALWAGLGHAPASGQGVETLAGAASGGLGATGVVSMDGSTGANSAMSWGSAIDSRDPSMQQSFSALSAASAAGLPSAVANCGGQGSSDSSPAAAPGALDCRPQRLLSQLKIGELPFFGLPSKLLPPSRQGPNSGLLELEQERQEAEGDAAATAFAAARVAAVWQQPSEPPPCSALDSPSTAGGGLVQQPGALGGGMDATLTGPLQDQASGPAPAAGAEDTQASVEEALRRRAKRLLPFCLSRGMPHTAAQVLRYLLEVSGVSLAALDADLTGSSDQAAQRPLQQWSEEAEATAGTEQEYQDVQQEQQPVRLGLIAQAVCSGNTQCVDLLLRAGLAVGNLWNPLQPQGKVVRLYQIAVVACVKSPTCNRTAAHNTVCYYLFPRIQSCHALPFIIAMLLLRQLPG